MFFWHKTMPVINKWVITTQVTLKRRLSLSEGFSGSHIEPRGSLEAVPTSLGVRHWTKKIALKWYLNSIKKPIKEGNVEFSWMSTITHSNSLRKGLRNTLSFITKLSHYTSDFKKIWQPHLYFSLFKFWNYFCSSLKYSFKLFINIMDIKWSWLIISQKPLMTIANSLEIFFWITNFLSIVLKKSSFQFQILHGR